MTKSISTNIQAKIFAQQPTGFIDYSSGIATPIPASSVEYVLYLFHKTHTPTESSICQTSLGYDRYDAFLIYSAILDVIENEVSYDELRVKDKEDRRKHVIEPIQDKLKKFRIKFLINERKRRIRLGH